MKNYPNYRITEEEVQIIQNFEKEYKDFQNSPETSFITNYLKKKQISDPTSIKIKENIIITSKKSIKTLNTFSIIKYKNNTLYIGEMYQKKRNGFGIRTFPPNNYIYYIGNYKANKKAGPGNIFRFEDNFLIFQGQWENDLKNGIGRLHGENAFYEGSFVEDEMEGDGQMSWDNGDFYEGGFHRGVKEGMGTIVYGNGDRFRGLFRDNVISGNGVYEWSTGEIWNGGFQGGRVVGDGELAFKEFGNYNSNFYR